jgi:tetratricopeptide (TPR) repeat protein
MQSIIDMNNKAALLMDDALYKEAIEILDNALDSMQTTLDVDSQELIVTKDRVCSRNDSWRSTPENPISPIADFEHDEDYIYRSPICILEEEDEPDKFTMRVIILFNTALSHHLKTTQGEKVSTQRLRKALKLYEHCFCMELRGDCQLTMTHILALVNNCGLIYRQLNRERKAERFFQHMLSTLMTMSEVGEAEDVEELDGFMWNASKIILNDPAFAPAA